MENTKTIEQTLAKAIFEVFEKMFFVFAEPYRDEAPPQFHWRARIGFRSPFAGTMALDLSRPLAETLACNMLSLEREEITDVVIADCAKESLNMICGNFLRQVDPDHGATLTIPTCEPLAGPPASGSQGQPGLTLAFSTDDGAFGVTLRRDENLE